MLNRVFLCVVFLSLVALGATQENLVFNPGFEQPLDDSWRAANFELSLSPDAHSGSASLKSSGRMVRKKQGPVYTMDNLMPGRAYNVTAYFKQLNDLPEKLYQGYKLTLVFVYDDDSVIKKLVAHETEIRTADGWFQMAGHFRAPKEEFSFAELRVLWPDVGIDFLLDDLSVTELPPLHYWEKKANERIKQLRMGVIHFRFSAAPCFDPRELDVEIDLVKHKFAFGTMVKEELMLDKKFKKYQDLVYNNFNTATIQKVKWKQDRGTRFEPDFSLAVNCSRALKARGMTVRAHALFWGFKKNIPDYVPDLDDEELRLEVNDHTQYMINLMKGHVDHWDVMNENVHGHWYEERFMDPAFSENVFKQVNETDPDPLLMLNDFRAIARPAISQAYLRQARRFLDHGVPLGALGIQSHFKGTQPDPQLMLLDLDRLAEAGLPLWVTELNLYQTNIAVRAEHYDTAMRVYFSHPAVHGVVLWGIWQHQFHDDSNRHAVLVNGWEMNVNAAGRRVFGLINSEWSTHVRRTLASGTKFDVEGFKGQYKVKVKYLDVTVKEVEFSLTGEETTIDMGLCAR